MYKLPIIINHSSVIIKKGDVPLQNPLRRDFYMTQNFLFYLFLVSSFIRPARPNQHSIILFSAELFSDTRLSQQPTGGVLKYFEDWLAGVQRSSRQKKPLKRSIKKRVIMQNKPNFQNAQMNVNTVITKDYENKRLYRCVKTNPIQTQYNPKTNPICVEPKMNERCNV